MPTVFVSYCSADRPLVEREIITPLTFHGIETWYSRDDIRAASDWERSIRQALSACDWFLVALSSRSVDSEWVRSELHWAMEHRPNRIVPVLLETCDPTKLHLRLSLLQYIDFRTDLQTARRELLAVWDTDHAHVGQGEVVLELTRIRNLADPEWEGPIPPVASLDIWIRYSGPGLLFLEAVKLHHIESPLHSAASGIFPPSHRYRIEYERGQSYDLDLDPPLVINPEDQDEIHFELEIVPRSVVGELGCCIAFLAARSSTSGTARLPLFSPYVDDIVASRVLGRPIRMEAAALFQRWSRWRTIPAESYSGHHLCAVHPNGVLSVPVVDDRVPPEEAPPTDLSSELRVHLKKLGAIALDGTERERTGVGAIRLLGQVGDEGAQSLLEQVIERSSSALRREVAAQTLRRLRAGLVRKSKE